MNEKQDEPVLPTTRHQVPDWEPAAAGANGAVKRPIGEILRNKLDTVMSPNRKYLGMRRRVFLLVVAGALLALIALIVGLSVGLTAGASGGGSKNLPLPTNSKTWSGELTFYNPSMGSCGIQSSDSDKVVAVSHKLWDQVSKASGITNPNANPLCGLKLRAQRFYTQKGEERSADVKVVDRCVGCEKTDLDMSPGAFDEIASAGDGRVDVTWAWLDTIPAGALDR
ncbi:riboflavin aldehyde-forming enzyme [Phyllosticta capitalensis]|uniref:Riboflavin aldehyde-forming enzyme n=1 Tax=Phyllosticta capitalensis TaxID=121624 RepID=A0ABR1Z1T1_9PEZI